MELKDLKELLKVLRDKGVTEYECNGVRLKLSEEAPISKYKKRQDVVEIEPEEEELSYEERLFWSAASNIPVENQTEAQTNTESA